MIKNNNFIPYIPNRLRTIVVEYVVKLFFESDINYNEDADIKRISAWFSYFDLQYVGKWFEIERYPVPEQTGSCNQVIYTEEGGIRGVHHNEVVNRTLQTQFGTATLADDGSGLFTVVYGGTLLLDRNAWTV